ncbi:MAG: DNA-protecting protein DprA [Campylobacteraceae bacterium]|nr:DNA-protecting protein DprA [Campylobacteraceae bacterium]
MSIIDISEFEPLQRVENPPKKLYYKGNLKLLEKRKVSIVGSRKMTIYTKNLVLSLANELKKRDICVVSGCAIGVDAAAHKGAFPNTIAVFGNGLDEIYPKTNSKLINDIYENSLALSEYEPSQKAWGQQFLERNRIVVGLSEALVVAQADLRSGSLQSARLASEMGIPVFVFPHRINESRGTNELLAKGKASLIDNIEEFANSFVSFDEIKVGDEFLEFVEKNSSFDEIWAKFGDLVYEYELDGRIEILGTKVLVK